MVRTVEFGVRKNARDATVAHIGGRHCPRKRGAYRLQLHDRDVAK